MEVFMEHWAQLGETFTQMIAFVIFFWILKAFAWGPLQDVLEKRQQAIEDGFVKIDKSQAEAEKLRTEYEARLRDIEQEARAKIQEAVAEGRRVAAELADNARREAEDIRAKAEQSIRHETAKARIELRDDIVAITLEASEKLMRRRMNAEDDRRLAAAFIDDLQGQSRS